MPEAGDGAPVESPCNSVCRLNADGVCMGCGRRVGEIAEWLDAGPERRSAIRRDAAARLASLRGRPPA